MGGLSASSSHASEAEVQRYRFFKWLILGVLICLLVILVAMRSWSGSGPTATVPSVPGAASTVHDVDVARLTLPVLQLGTFSAVGATDHVAGNLALTGVGDPNLTIHIVEEDALIGMTTVDSRGNWSLDKNLTLRPGRYTYVAQMFGTDDTLLAKSDPFDVVIPEVAGRDEYAQDAQNDVAKAQQKLDRMQNQLEAVQTESQQWQTQHASAAQTLAMVQEELRGARGEVAIARRQLQTAEKERTTWRSQIDACTAALTQTRQTADRLQTQLEMQATQWKQDATHLRTLHTQATQRLQDAVQRRDVTIQQAPDRLTIQVGGNALFAPGQTSLRNASLQTLDEVADVLRGLTDYQIRVGGHTDNTPLKASNPRWPSNWELSSARAAAVVRYLEKQDIAPERLFVVGHAFHRPIASHDTPEGRARNRRIDITLIPGSR